MSCGSHRQPEDADREAYYRAGWEARGEWDRELAEQRGIERLSGHREDMGRLLAAAEREVIRAVEIAFRDCLDGAQPGRQPPKPIKRMNTHDGRQIVSVGRYAYQWDGPEPLVVGDRVLLPENFITKVTVGSGPFEGTVSALGTTYVGELASVVAKVPDTHLGTHDR